MQERLTKICASILLCGVAWNVGWIANAFEDDSGLFLIFCGLAGYIFTSLFFEENKKYILGNVWGLSMLIFLLGWNNFLLWISVCFAIFLVCVFTERVSIRALICVLLVGSAYLLRIRGYFQIWFWWYFIHWIRMTTFVIDVKKEDYNTAQNLGRSLFYLVAPPFFISPLALECLSFHWFRKSEIERKKEASRITSIRGLKFVTYGVLALIIMSFMARYKAEFQSIFRVPLYENRPSLFWAVAMGYSVYVLTFLRFAAVSLIASGVFYLAGFQIPPGFKNPFFSNNYLDFCKKNNYYFIQINVDYFYLPVLFKSVRWVPIKVAMVLGIIAALSFAGIQQLISVIPGIFEKVSFVTHYSLACTVEHRIWEFVLIGATFSFYLLVKKLEKKATKHINALMNLACVILTVFAVGIHYYNTYALCWRGVSTADIFGLFSHIY